MSEFIFEAEKSWEFNVHLDRTAPVEADARRAVEFAWLAALDTIAHGTSCVAELQPRMGGDTTLNAVVRFRPRANISVSDVEAILLEAARSTQLNVSPDRKWKRHVPATAYLIGPLAAPLLLPFALVGAVAGIATASNESASERASEAWRRTAGFVIDRSTINQSTEATSLATPPTSSTLVGRALTTVTGEPRVSSIAARNGASPGREVVENVAAYVPGNQPVLMVILGTAAVLVAVATVGYTVRAFK